MDGMGMMITRFKVSLIQNILLEKSKWSQLMMKLSSVWMRA